MRLDETRARELFAVAQVARLATASADARPHIVPIVFAVDGDVIYTAVDAKPKRSTALRRLANIAENPQVAVLADHYDDDWAQLWWARADGIARLAAGAEAAHGLARLSARYRQYETQPPPGPVLAIEVSRWSGWSAAAATPTAQ